MFGGRLDETGLTEAAFDRLLERGVAETDQLDFKRVKQGAVPYPGKSPEINSGWLEEQEFAKDVVAFANHRGGGLLIGIGEDATTKVANKLTPVTVSSPAAERQRLDEALLNYVAPPPEVSFVPIQAEAGGWYLAVVVPPSPRAPHAVLGRDKKKRKLWYPVRHDEGTRWLNEHEVAERYRRRQAVQEDQGSRVRRTVVEGSNALALSSGVWLYVAAVPEFPVRDARLDTATVDRIHAWHHNFSMPSPLGRDLSAYGRGIPAPGKVTFSDNRTSIHDDETAIRLGYVELWVDGSAFAAKPTVPVPRKDALHQVSYGALADDLVMLVDVALRWCADEAGSFGVATVVSGLVEVDTDDGRITTPLTLFDDRGPVPGARKVAGLPVVTLTADLSVVETVQQRLVVTHLLHSGLLHWFGLPESHAIRRGGQIDPGRFTGSSTAHQAEDWARAYNVELWQKQSG